MYSSQAHQEVGKIRSVVVPPLKQKLRQQDLGLDLARSSYSKSKSLLPLCGLL